MAETISLGARVDYSNQGGPSYGGGGAITGTDALSLFQNNLGKKLSHVMISGRWQDSGVYHQFSTYLANCDILHNAGYMPFLEWVPLDLAVPNNNVNLQLGRIVAGNHDAYITGFATAIKTWGKPVLLRIFTEENITASINNGYHYQYGSGSAVATYGANSWTNTLALFQAAWRKIVGIFKTTVGCTNARFVWSPNIRSTSGTSSVLTYVQMDGGNAALGLVDYLGFDGYTQRPDRTLADTFQGGVGGLADSYGGMCAVHPTLPILVPETGFLGTMTVPAAATITSSGTQWTITTTAQPGGANAETWLATNGIVITGSTPSGYNGQYTIASVSGTGPYTIIVTNATVLAASSGAQVTNVDRIRRAAAVTQSFEIDLPQSMPRIKGLTLFWRDYSPQQWTMDWDGNASQAANIDMVALSKAAGNAHYLAGNQMGTTATRSWVPFQDQPMLSPTERYRAIAKSTT